MSMTQVIGGIHERRRSKTVSTLNSCRGWCGYRGFREGLWLPEVSPPVRREEVTHTLDCGAGLAETLREGPHGRPECRVKQNETGVLLCYTGVSSLRLFASMQCVGFTGIRMRWGNPGFARRSRGTPFALNKKHLRRHGQTEHFACNGTHWGDFDGNQKRLPDLYDTTVRIRLFGDGSLICARLRSCPGACPSLRRGGGRRSRGGE